MLPSGIYEQLVNTKISTELSNLFNRDCIIFVTVILQARTENL